MRIPTPLCYAVLCLICCSESTLAARKPANSVLLTDVKTLTLRKDLKTSHRRVAPVPQLKCVGGNARGLYEVDVLRCKNQGTDYDEDNVQWTCTASLPPQFKLGSTDVICEGYTSSKDPYILKGSCGVEYRLVLTEQGEREYGRGAGDLWRGFKRRSQIDWAAWLFWGCFVGVLGWMVYSAFFRDRGAARIPGATGPWGWGGGGGGGGGGHDPPPPYDFGAAPKRGAGETWRPGFWTGLLGGTAAGYMSGNRGRNQWTVGGFWGDDRRGGDDGGWGRRDGGQGSSGSSSSSSSSTARYESSGFGSTSRR